MVRRMRSSEVPRTRSSYTERKARQGGCRQRWRYSEGETGSVESRRGRSKAWQRNRRCRMDWGRSDSFGNVVENMGERACLGKAWSECKWRTHVPHSCLILAWCPATRSNFQGILTPSWASSSTNSPIAQLIPNRFGKFYVSILSPRLLPPPSSLIIIIISFFYIHHKFSFSLKTK